MDEEDITTTEDVSYDDGGLRAVLKDWGGVLTVKQLQEYGLDVWEGVAVGATLITAFFSLLLVPSTGNSYVDIGLAILVPGTIVIIGLSWTFILTPDSENPLTHAWTRVLYYFTPKKYSLNGQVEGTADVRDIVGVDEFLDYYDPLARRTDGAYTAMGDVNGQQMDLAGNKEWARSARDFGSFINSLNSPLEIHSPGRTIDTDRIVGDMDERLTDPDIQANDGLKDVVIEHKEMLPYELKNHGSNVREYYVGTDMSRHQVLMNEHAVMTRVDRLPLVGGVIVWVSMNVVGYIPGIGGWLKRRGILAEPRSEKEIEFGQQRDVNENMESIINGLEDINSVSADRCSLDEMMTLTEEYYTGRRVFENNHQLQRAPVITIDEVDLTDIEDDELADDSTNLVDDSVSDDELAEMDDIDLNDPEAAIEQLEREQTTV